MRLNSSSPHCGSMNTVGDFMLERLSAWGIGRVFCYPGDGINGLLRDRAARPATSAGGAQPDAMELERAAAVISASKKVAILVCHRT